MGAFGEVFSVSKGEKQYAIKIVSEIDHNSEVEISLAKSYSLNSPFLVKYYDTFRDLSTPGKTFIVMELCEKGDLSGLVNSLKGKSGVQITADRLMKIFIQLVLGLDTLHFNKMIHRGVKAENVLIGSQDDCKLCDFGEMRILEYTDQEASTYVGTMAYMSPEIFEGKKYGTKTDIWSLGVLMYLLCSFELPFAAPSPYMIAQVVIAGKYKPIPEGRYSDSICALVYSLLAVNPHDRPSTQEILGNPMVLEYAKKFDLFKFFPASVLGGK